MSWAFALNVIVNKVNTNSNFNFIKASYILVRHIIFVQKEIDVENIGRVWDYKHTSKVFIFKTFALRDY